MNEKNNDRFETLISAAVADCVYQTADEFSAVDTSAVPNTSRLYKRVMRNLPGKKRTTVKTIIAVAVIAAMLALTACACVQEIREYVWSVVIEWCGDHYEVSFESEPAATEEPQTTAPGAELPTSIERIAKLTCLPNGSTKAYEISGSSQYFTEYNLQNESAFIFVQCTYNTTNSFMDGETANTVYVQVNGCESVLTEAVDGEDIVYSLFWQDDQYRYCLQGYFTSITDLIRIAESVSLE